MKEKIIAVDFDGTVVMHKYPQVGSDVPNAVRVLKRLIEANVKLILWTIRSGKELQDAVNWFQERSITLWGINENPQQKEWSNSPKVYAQCYIDDANISTFLVEPKADGQRVYIDWFYVEQWLENEGFLNGEQTNEMDNQSMEANV